MVTMVRDPELAFDDLGNASAGPHVTDEAEGRCSARQEGRQSGQVLRGKAGGRRWRAAGAQRFHATFTPASQPLADGTLGDTEGFSDLVLLPALLVQFPSTQATAFTPILWRSRCPHGQYATMSIDALLVLYAVVSST